MTTSSTSLAAELVRLSPAPSSERTAARAALTMLVSLLVLAQAGRLDLSAYATFGAFASVYGGGTLARRRWRLQASAGVLLVAAVLTGALVGTLDQRAWVAVPVAATWAAVASTVADARGWRPPGPMFFVFAFGTCSAIPTDVATLPLAALVALTTAATAVAIGVFEVAAERSRGLVVLDDVPRLPPHPQWRRRVQAARCAVAVLVAGGLMTAAGIPHPYWAMVAAVVPLAAPRLRLQVVRGVHRVAGTAVGLGVAAVLLVPDLSPFATVFVVAGLQAAVELLVVRHYGLALVFITPLALLVGQLAHRQDVGTLLASRGVETLAGVAVGLVVAWVTRPRAPLS